MRIIYLLSHVRKPAGGHSVIIDHVEALREAGFDAYIYYTPTTDYSFYREITAERIVLQCNPFSSFSDRLVVPEADLLLWASQIIEARKDDLSNVFILNQNHFYTYNHRDDEHSWTVFRKARHISTSESIRKFLLSIFPSQEIPLIPVYINQSLFRPAAKILQIAYMPRKIPDAAAFIRRHLHESYPELSSIPWIEIDGLNHPEVAGILNHSAFFLSLARHEGFGMPALEAMLAGCIVVGFTGFGGDEYASSRNGMWVNENDVITATKRLGMVVNDYLRKEKYLAQVSLLAHQTGKLYDKDRFVKALIQTWTRLT